MTVAYVTQLFVHAHHADRGTMKGSATFMATDAGRSQSRRPRQKNDCTVRALALTTGADYDATYDALAEAGRRCSQGFDFRTWAKDGVHNGFRFVWRPFPARRWAWRMNPVTFAMSHPRGRYILRVSKHVFACIDGMLMDTAPVETMRCVYGAWEVVPVGEPS